MVAIDKPVVKNQVKARLADNSYENAQLPAQSDLVIIIPAFNEARFIGSVVLKSRRFTNAVLVIDDGSTDDTALIAHSAGAIVLSHKTNQGKGTALNTGFRAARQYQPSVIVCLDGDGQHTPNEIALLLEPIQSQQADIVIGSRYIGSNNQIPRSRVFGHRIFNFLIRHASGKDSSDSQSGFRAFSPLALEVLSFCSQDFSVESEMQFLALEHNLRVIEVPVTITYQDPPKRSLLLHGLSVFNGILRLVGQHRPLLYFGLSGSIVLGSGILFGFRVINIFSQSGQLAVGTAFISLLFSMIGMMLITTGFSLHSIRALLIDLINTLSNR